MKEDLRKVQKEIEKLREEIRHHDYKYFVENAPLISDREYDALYSRLKELEEKCPQFKTADSPTQRVGGAPLEGFKTVKHIIPMLSMDNTYSEGESRDFNRRVEKNLGTQTINYVVELNHLGWGIFVFRHQLRIALNRTYRILNIVHDGRCEFPHQFQSFFSDNFLLRLLQPAVHLFQFSVLFLQYMNQFQIGLPQEI